MISQNNNGDGQHLSSISKCLTALSHLSRTATQPKLRFYCPDYIDGKMEAQGLMLTFPRVVSVRARRGAWAGDRLCALDHHTCENAGAAPCPMRTWVPVLQGGLLLLAFLPDTAFPERPAPSSSQSWWFVALAFWGLETAPDGEGHI